jgi:DNA adenine methylase
MQTELRQHSKTFNLAQDKGKKDPLIQPFLKWAGGKRQLLKQILECIPRNISTYYEPFVGAGALLLALQHDTCVINDANEELINCYQVIKQAPQDLIALCAEYKKMSSQKFFYEIRNQDRTESFHLLTPVQRAARIIYLNKTCFNGLFRVNSKGQFNVPYGSYTNPQIINEDIIKAVSNYLNQNEIQILTGDFATCVSDIASGAFVYCDPPYYPLSDTSSFTGYGQSGFGAAEQKRLKQLCDTLSEKGCNVLVSNSNTAFIRELYDDPCYQVIEVQATRAINSVGSKRGTVSEVLITNKYKY